MRVEMWLSWFLTILPVIYVFTTFILISWGTVVFFALRSVMKNVSSDEIDHNVEVQTNSHIRKTDRTYLTITSCILLFQIIGVIFAPVYLIAYLDVLLLTNFWILVFYCVVSFTCLLSWNKVLSKQPIRVVEREGTSGPYVIR